VGVALLLVSALSWALGTQLMRHTRIEAHTLTLSFWMTALTAVFLSAMSLAFEADRWQAPSATAWGAIVFNAVVVFGLVLPKLGMILSLPLLVLIASYAGDEFHIGEVAINSVVLTVFSWAIFIWGLNLTIPLWPSFLGAR
jgi:drug/metabolite transporter (DMT)-like permease